MKLTLCVLVCCLSVFADNCSQFSKPLGPFAYGLVGTEHHINGAHQWSTSQSGKCSYAGTKGPCAITSTASSLSPGISETGLLSVQSVGHYGAGATQQGMATSTGTPATSHTMAAADFKECLGSCTVSPTITALWPFSVSFPPNPIFSDAKHWDNTCPVHNAVVPRPKPPQPCTKDSANNCTPGSPILLDTTNKGYHMSDPDVSYVSFDIKGNGTELPVSWPIIGSGNGWLVLDRDHNHRIDNGAELFGNWTPRPGETEPPADNPDWNGFLALAAYDLPANGGNMDGMIDWRDAIWPKLKVWVDRHCALHPKRPCHARRKELHTLQSLNINSLALVYALEAKFDKYGNEFRYSAVVNPDDRSHPQHSSDPRLGYDVYLVTRGGTDRGPHDNTMP